MHGREPSGYSTFSNLDMSIIKLKFENVVSAIIRIIYFRFVIGCKGLVSKEFKQSIEKQSWPQPAPALAPASSTSPVIIVIFIVTIQFVPNWKWKSVKLYDGKICLDFTEILIQSNNILTSLMSGYKNSPERYIEALEVYN